ncbi:MAG: prepilin-type N-terminal cleavage/methylation domain-containing protein [Planktothrix sp.]
MINHKKACDRSLSYSGFTLIELLIVILIIGILSAIVVPSWLGFINRYRLKTSTDQLQWAFRMAQSNAKRDKIAWQVSIQETPKSIQFNLHPANIAPVQLPAGSWTTLTPGILIDDKQPNLKGKLETSLRKINPTTNKVTTSGTMYRTLFNYKGCPVYFPNDECTQTSLQALGTITLNHPDLGNTKRCVIISTVLGVTRIGKENIKPNTNDRYCY